MKPVTDADYDRIKALGNRCGFTDRYYFDHNGSDMVTYVLSLIHIYRRIRSRGTKTNMVYMKVHICGKIRTKNF